MADWSLVGSFDQVMHLGGWVLKYGDKLWAGAQDFIERPDLFVTSRLSRLGDLVVWNSDSGTKVLAGLDGLSDKVDRIDSAVSGIESTQLAMAGTLGVVQSVSIATLGVTSLSAAFMLWRFNALNKRLTAINDRLESIEAKIEAQNRAHIKDSLQYLSDYERGGNDKMLDNALSRAMTATNTYNDVVRAEVDRDRVRLPVLNYMTRCYLLSVLVQLECLILTEQQASALDRIMEQKAQLQQLANVTFHETVGKAPEAYLDPNLKNDGVTLELLAEVYRQARYAGALTEPEIHDAAEMFEHLRNDVYRRRFGTWWVWRAVGAAKKRYITGLRYLLACLEDVNRVESMRLLLDDAENRQAKLRDLMTQLKTWRQERLARGGDTGQDDILAYALT